MPQATGSPGLTSATDLHGRELASQELRLALVMNGGVSLAVWIGGVCREVHRFARRDGVYGGLMELMRTSPRVDVISGTSAGGINGAFLAMALACNSDLSALRRIWIDRGAFAALLRSPFEKDPPSLLKGDDYLLEELRLAFRELWREAPDQRAPAREVPLDLTLTTTLLSGQSTNLWDDFGTLISDVDHRGRFHFRRCGDDDDPFADESIIDKLSVAARSTSSFPGAFEPSYCPLGRKTQKPSRPDMHGIATFEGGEKKGVFVIDGGVLDNKPLGPAIRSIFEQRSESDIRRVLAYVVPDPREVGAVTGDDPAEIPSAGSVVLSSLVNLPRVESVRADLEQLRSHNDRVRTERQGRVSLLNAIAHDELEDLAEKLFGVYEARRSASANRARRQPDCRARVA